MPPLSSLCAVFGAQAEQGEQREHQRHNERRIFDRFHNGITSKGPNLGTGDE
jgi:hypothetical protein